MNCSKWNVEILSEWSVSSKQLSSTIFSFHAGNNSEIGWHFVTIQNKLTMVKTFFGSDGKAVQSFDNEMFCSDFLLKSHSPSFQDIAFLMILYVEKWQNVDLDKSFVCKSTLPLNWLIFLLFLLKSLFDLNRFLLHCCCIIILFY